MQLDTYIKQTVFSVLSGLKAADEILESRNLGSIWKGDFTTLAKDLVSVRLVKANDPKAQPGEKKSIPIMLFDYEIAVEVEDEKGEADKAEVGVAAKFLKVFSMSGKVEGSSEKKHGEKQGHTLRFTVPVSMHRE
jgi:hypothetical protein